MNNQESSVTNAAKPTLLIIDDQPASIFILGQMLRQEYRVDFATGGMEGLRKARQLQPDLILLDVSMPDMDGYTVCHHLKDEENTRDIPVLFITLLNDTEHESLGLQLGALDYITKPFDPETITRKIKNHMQTYKQLRTLTALNQTMAQQAQSRDRAEKLTLHDLKSPLGLIINLRSLLAELEGTTNAHMEVASMVEKAGYRMLDMIKHATDLYKLENHEMTLPNESIDLAALIEQVCHDMQPVASMRKVNVRIVNGQQVGYRVQGAYHLLYSLFCNLLKNAIEASPVRKDVTIRLHAGHSVHIHNHGSVPDTIRGSFFEKFVTNGKRHGSGLGTYAASLICRLHRGEIVLCAGMDETEIAVQLPPLQLPQPEDARF
ncbi:MAG: response regulator [Magnetococcales bacterium]|nr:response regulator [Magnetococcales bacterium]